MISKPVSELHWWTSLVPAPAVIPAPIAYINAAAVKKLVVGYRAQVVLWPSGARSRECGGAILLDSTQHIKTCALGMVVMVPCY
jgi:hypothetical protein